VEKGSNKNVYHVIQEPHEPARPPPFIVSAAPRIGSVISS
jgi:hypothetical protein